METGAHSYAQLRLAFVPWSYYPIYALTIFGFYVLEHLGPQIYCTHSTIVSTHNSRWLLRAFYVPIGISYPDMCVLRIYWCYTTVPTRSHVHAPVCRWNLNNIAGSPHGLALIGASRSDMYYVHITKLMYMYCKTLLLIHVPGQISRLFCKCNLQCQFQILHESSHFWDTK